jgi:uncharacterized protein (TIGR03067 family)
MNRRRILGIALSALVLGGCANSARVRNPIEGTWFVTGATMAGQDVPLAEFDGWVLNLDGGRYQFHDDRGEYALLSGTHPAQIDIHGQDGPNAGRTYLAIFALDGNTLTIVYDLSGKARPTRFESRVGTQEFLVRYKRS